MELLAGLVQGSQTEVWFKNGDCIVARIPVSPEADVVFVNSKSTPITITAADLAIPNTPPLPFRSGRPGFPITVDPGNSLTIPGPILR